MDETRCEHEWAPANVQSGYLVIEGCSHCGIRQTLFTLDDRHHMDSYVKGKHKWRPLGSSQAVKFDLKCGKCGKVVRLEKAIGLMLCTECRQDCAAGTLAKHSPSEQVWVYLALCPDSSHVSEKCIGPEEIEALNRFFNDRIKTPGKRIVIVPCDMRPSIDICEGEILADVGMIDLI